MRPQFISFLLFAILVTFPVHAGTIAVNFDSPELYGSPADTLTFSGTLINSGSTVYINGADFNIEAFGLADYSLDDFMSYALLLPPLNDGDSSGPFSFFTVTIPAGFADGAYAGTLTVKGGATVDDDAVLGSGSFTVRVGQEVTAVPEPGYLLLLVGLSAAHRSR